MVVCAFAAIMPAEQTDAAAGDTLYISGTIDKKTDYDGNIVVVDDDLVITTPKDAEAVNVNVKAGTTLIINEGVTVTIEKGAILNIADGIKAITVNGNIVVTGAGSALKVGSGFNDVDHTGGITVASTGSITAEKGASIEGLDTYGSIVLKSGATLEVTKQSSNISKIRSVEVVIYDGATFSTEGYFKNVVVRAMGDATYYTAGAMYLNNENMDSPAANNRDTSDLTFTVTTQTATAYYNTGTNTAEKASIRQYVLNVDGTVDGYTTAANANSPDWLLFEPRTDDKLINENSFPGCLWTGAAKLETTVEGKQVRQYQDMAYYTTEDAAKAATSLGDYIKAMTSVTGNLDITENGKVSFASASYINISGTVDIAYNEKAQAPDSTGAKNTQLKGYLNITGTFTANAANLKDIKNPTIYVNGGSVDIIEGDENTLISTDGTTATAKIYGVGYVDDSASDEVFKIRDIGVAVTEATAIGADVYVYGLATIDDVTGIEDAEDAVGAYIISSDVTFPDGMTVNFVNTTYIAAGATVTFQDGADADLTTPYNIIVDGKLVDQDGGISASEANVSFEVKKTNADETETTYTTLAIAIGEAQAGESIQLVGQVTITENTTIPADVTVIVGESLTVKGVTLTVNGVLDMGEDGTLATAKSDGENPTDGAVVVNNYIANVTSISTQITGVPGAYFTGQIRADDDVDTNYIASPAVAGQYCTSDVTIYGKISAGAVTFTQDDAPMTITIVGEVTGDITMVGNEMEFALTGSGASFTGSVTSAVTSGTSTIDFNKAGGATVSIDSADDGETVTTVLVLDGTITGSATISAGAVQAGPALKTPVYGDKDKVRNTLTVASGATLDIVDGSGLTVQAGTETVNGKEENYATLVVDGTLAYADGAITNTGAIIAINGTMTVAKGTTVAGIVNVAGSLTVAADEQLQVEKMYVGSAAESLGVGGSIAGDIKTTKFIVAYAGADVSGATINDNNGETDAEVTAYYINGTLYMTSYAVSGQYLKDIIPETIELTGYENVYYSSNASEGSNWYTDEAMKTPLAYNASETVDDVTALYAKAEVSQALVYVSVGANMTVFIDDVRYSNGAILALDVGQHTITVQVNAGYTGETSVLIGGTAVTGGTFEITPQMAEDYGGTVSDSTTSSDCVVLSITGGISIDSGATGGDDGMGLTEILLVILVVLIVIMAIMVALRLMRS